MNINAKTIDRVLSILVYVAIIIGMLLNLIPLWLAMLSIPLLLILDYVTRISIAIETALKKIQEEPENEIEYFEIVNKQTGERVATVNSDMISVGEAYEVVITKKE